MMEFDKSTPVSDEQRRLAETKKITLQPIHGDISPDDLPDSAIVAHHLTGPAIANIENDTEQNARLIKPSKALIENTPPSKSHKMAIVSGSILLTVAIAGACVFVMMLVV